MLRKLILWIALSLLVISCSAAPQPAPTFTAATVTDKGLPAKSLVLTYKRSGGFTGQLNAWSIYADGHVQSNQANENLQVSVDEVQALRALLIKIGLPALSKATKTPTGCADCYTYSITLLDAGSEYTYSFTPDGRTSDIDDALVTTLDAFIRKAGGK
jgi:hypothetical protein